MTEYYHTGSGGVWPSHHRDEEKDTGWDLRGHKTPWSCRSELEKKLGRHRFDYFRKVVLLETLRHLLTEKKKDFDNLSEEERHELEKIELILQNGGSFDNYIDQKRHLSSTTLQGGEFYELTIPINGLKPHVFVKLFPDKRTYQTSKRVQERVARISKNVVGPTYYDDKLRIMTTPFLEGQTLDEKLANCNGNIGMKRKELERGIDVLTDIHIKGTRDKFSDIPLVEIKNPAHSFVYKFLFATNQVLKKSNTNIFGKLKLRDKDLGSLVDMYSHGVGAQINQDGSQSRLIHGDPHPRNFIEADGNLYLIDFDLARFGNLHLDLFKLFEKTGALSNQELKKHLLDYAFEKIKADILITKQDFIQRYDFTETHEYFMCAGRYLSFSQDPKITKEFGKKEALRDTACLYYTRALNNLKTLGLDALASSIESFVDRHYKGEMHRLSELDMQRIRHLPDDCMLSTILSKGSLNEIALYNKAKKRIKQLSAWRKIKTGSKIGAALGAVVLAAYMGVVGGNSSNENSRFKSIDAVGNINQFMMLKGDEIYGTSIYNEELRDLIFVKGSEQLYKTLGGQNNTILSDQKFKKFFIKKRKEDGGSASGLVNYLESYAMRERADPEAFAALVYATLLDSPERKALKSKGRFGLGLISQSHLESLLKVRDEPVPGRFQDDFLNLLFTGRALTYFIMQNNGEVYTSLADYFFGKDVVDKARASVDSNTATNDINQYWNYLPEGPEKTLLAKAIGFYEGCKSEKHNKFVLGNEWQRIKKVIEKDLLLWEYNYNEYGKRNFKPGSEMIKTLEYKKFIDKYHNKELALIACYDEEVLKKAIDAASKTHMNTISEFLPITLEKEAAFTVSPPIDGWFKFYGSGRGPR